MRHVDETRFLVEDATARVADLDPRAMEWLFTVNDFCDTDTDKFLEGLPGYIHSRNTEDAIQGLPKVLTESYILQRIREHLLTCITAKKLSEEARINRALACVELSSELTPLNDLEVVCHVLPSFPHHLFSINHMYFQSTT